MKKIAILKIKGGERNADTQGGIFLPLLHKTLKVLRDLGVKGWEIQEEDPECALLFWRAADYFWEKLRQSFIHFLSEEVNKK